MVSYRMARTLPLHFHLPAAELSRRARQAANLVEARRWQLLALIADGKTVKAAAQIVGLYPPYARRLVHRSSPSAPGDGQSGEGGHAPAARQPRALLPAPVPARSRSVSALAVDPPFCQTSVQRLSQVIERLRDPEASEVEGQGPMLPHRLPQSQ